MIANMVVAKWIADDLEFDQLILGCCTGCKGLEQGCYEMVDSRWKDQVLNRQSV